MGCKATDCGNVERCIDLPFGSTKCWVIDCPCKPDETEMEQNDLLAITGLDKDSKWYCSADQCDMTVTKCIDVPVKGEVCWDVTCPPCMTPKDEGLAAANKADEENKKKKKDDDKKKKFSCQPKECGTTKEVCIDVPVKGEVCWDVKCPACKAPAEEEAEVMPVSVVEKKKKDDDEKKKFACQPKECGTTKEVCIDVPVKGEVCWDIKCPACKAPAEEAEVMPVSVVEKKKKDDDKKKKFACQPKECGTTKEVCIDVPVKGEVCWDIKCPACKAPAEEAEVMPFLSAVEKKKQKDDDKKKKFSCQPKECGTTKEVCIDVPVKGEVCWDVKCPACKAPAEEAEVMPVSVVEKKKKKDDDKKKFSCQPKECGTTKEVCIDVPVKGEVCWDVKCPACKAPAEEAEVMAVSVVEKKGDDKKKKFACQPKECGTTKEVCIDVPVKGEVCWDVKCPACKAPAEEAEVMPVSVVEKKKKDDDKKKFSCQPKECGTTKEVCIDVPVKGEVCWDVKCPACKAPAEEAEVMPLSVVEKKKTKDDKKKFACQPKECGTTKEVCIDVPVKGKVCWDVKCPACADETTGVIYA